MARSRRTTSAGAWPLRTRWRRALYAALCAALLTPLVTAGPGIAPIAAGAQPPATLPSVSLPYRFTAALAGDTAWWTGVVAHGHRLPVRAGYTADLVANTYGNQAQPLLLSDRGGVVWSEAPFRVDATADTLRVAGGAPLVYVRAGTTLRDAYRYASRRYFPPSGRMPDPRLFAAPQYNTWIELTYDQNQRDVLRYARGAATHGFPPGVLMVDDNWQEAYGRWRFHPGRFPAPRAMVDSLHALGFAVMLWVCPFVSADTDVYRALRDSGYLVRDTTGQPAIVRWWNGASALLDFTHPGAAAWFMRQLDALRRDYGVDGFKFDGGDPEYYARTVAHRPVTANAHTALYGAVGLRYPLNEYRAMWGMGGQPLAERLRDKAHRWEDLPQLIPDATTAGLAGYPFAAPDMIGGGDYTSFRPGAPLDRELVVRWAQAAALMPMMQFSAAPWRVLAAADVAEAMPAGRSAIAARAAEQVHYAVQRFTPDELRAIAAPSAADRVMAGAHVMVRARVAAALDPHALGRDDV